MQRARTCERLRRPCTWYTVVFNTVAEMPGEAHISCLFPEILAIIFGYLDVRGKGRAARVCRAWREASYHRSVWRGVEAKLHLRRANSSLFPSLVTRGIRRVQILSLRSKSLSHVLQGMANIQSLNLSGCFSLTDIGLANAFQHEIPTLIVLNLSLCKQVTDNSLWKIAQYLKNLESLDLGGCSNITNTGLHVIARGLHGLKSLNLRSCGKISDEGIGHLAGLNGETAKGTRDLEDLVLQDCQKLSDNALLSVAKGLLKLHNLNLSFCCGITDTGMINLSRMPSLRELNLRSCDNITDIGIAHLAECGGHFCTIDVSFCDKVGDASLGHLAQGMYNLTNISLSSCQITDEGLGRLVRNLRGLTTLNIGQCVKVTDKGLALIADNLPRLRCIDLYGCTKITTVGLEKIMQLPCLSVLNLGLWHKR